MCIMTERILWISPVTQSAQLSPLDTELELKKPQWTAMKYCHRKCASNGSQTRPPRRPAMMNKRGRNAQKRTCNLVPANSSKRGNTLCPAMATVRLRSGRVITEGCQILKAQWLYKLLARACNTINRCIDCEYVAVRVYPMLYVMSEWFSGPLCHCHGYQQQQQQQRQQTLCYWIQLNGALWTELTTIWKCQRARSQSLSPARAALAAMVLTVHSAIKTEKKNTYLLI